MAALREKRFDIKLPIFNESSGEDFHLRELRVKAALSRKDSIEAIEG